MPVLRGDLAPRSAGRAKRSPWSGTRSSAKTTNITTRAGQKAHRVSPNSGKSGSVKVHQQVVDCVARSGLVRQVKRLKTGTAPGPRPWETACDLKKKSPRLPRLPRRSGGRGVACRRDDEDGWNWPWDISTARRQCVGCDGVWRLATDGGPPRRVERRWEGRRAWKRSVWWGGISQPLARAKLAETRGTSGMWVLPERIDQWRHTKRNDCAGGPVSGNQTPAEADRQCGYLALPRGAAKAVTSKIELPVWQRRAQKRLAAAFPDPSTRQTGQWREWTSTHSAGCC